MSNQNEIERLLKLIKRHLVSIEVMLFIMLIVLASILYNATMATLTEEQIKEIAEMLDCGFRSYWHKLPAQA